MPTLCLERLAVDYTDEGKSTQVLRDVSFSVERGEIFALVGESGCGKSMTSLAIMDLLPLGFGIVSGKIFFGGKDLLCESAESKRLLKGKEMSMIFQDPLTALNPLLTVGFQVSENILVHEKVSKKQALARTAALLESVDIANAKTRLNDYPHQFSGGQRQRIMIAMAIACNPDLLIADEPTTALDVTVQSSIMDLLACLSAERQMSMILISHNLALVKNYCRRIAVMYGGSILEIGPADGIFSDSSHPYTQSLIKCLPTMKTNLSQRLCPIEGQPPSIWDRPMGCIFAGRCTMRKGEICFEQEPAVVQCGTDHFVRCHRYG